MKKAGLDIGYDSTKVKSGEVKEKFPSVEGTDYGDPFSLQDKVNGIRFDKPRQIVVGDSAVLNSAIDYRREDRNWILSDEYYSFFLAGASLITEESDTMKIVTGLPVAYISDRELLADRLHDNHFFVRKGRNEQVITVEEKPFIVPQPSGTVFDYFFDESGKAAKPWHVHAGVLDVGGGTTDFMHFKDMAEIPPETGTSIAGWKAVEMLRPEIERDHQDVVYDDHELVKAIVSKTLDYGEKVDISKIVDAITHDVARKIFADVTKKWSKSFGKMSVILLTGGGSLLLGETLKDYFRRGVLVDDPVFSNVSGFNKLANRG